MGFSWSWAAHVGANANVLFGANASPSFYFESKSKNGYSDEQKKKISIVINV